MSKTDSLHYQLCCEGAKWLRRQKRDPYKCNKKPCYKERSCPSYACNRFKYVAVELVSWGENTDVWGLGNYNESAVIEVKVSHADFLADQKKACRSKDAEEMGRQAGTYRWYLCPEGIIKPEELPDKWGLLYWNGKKVYPVVTPKKFENTAAADIDILTSILRREAFPERIYNYRSAPSTIKPKTINGIPEREYWKDKEKKKCEDCKWWYKDIGCCCPLAYSIGPDTAACEKFEPKIYI